MRKEKSAGAKSFRTFAVPVLAMLFIAALYYPLVDSVYYFLHGLEAQGMMLAWALAHGHGFVDLSLPGHPIHVREPPLFYLMLAGLIRLFGFRMLPFKVLMWAGYALSALFASLLFQKRTGRAPAFFATLFCFTSPSLYVFFTGPKSDVPFTALWLAALLTLEKYLEKSRENNAFKKSNSSVGEQKVSLQASKKERFFLPGLAACLAVCAVFTRSLGLAMVLAWMAVVILPFSSSPRAWSKKVKTAAVVLLPVAAAWSLWAARNALSENPAGYNYIDWFMMDLKPDSPEMTAIDFHAPLAAPPPRAELSAIVERTLRHVVFYFHSICLTLIDPRLFSGFGAASEAARSAAEVFFFIFMIAGVAAAEKRGSRLILFTFLIYLAAIWVWPMDDPRLLIPVLPIAAFYAVAGVHFLAEMLGKKLLTSSNGDRKGNRPGLGGAALSVPALVIFVLPAIAGNLFLNLRYLQEINRIPRIRFQPGFEVRFLDPARRDSFALLLWAKEHTPADAVIMYHSTPPCWVVTRRTCQAVPFTQDLDKVRAFIKDGGADYLVVDEWGKSFPRGPGWFVEHILRPVVKRYPRDFQELYRIPGTESAVYGVKRRRIKSD